MDCPKSSCHEWFLLHFKDQYGIQYTGPNPDQTFPPSCNGWFSFMSNNLLVPFDERCMKSASARADSASHGLKSSDSSLWNYVTTIRVIGRSMGLAFHPVGARHATQTEPMGQLELHLRRIVTHIPLPFEFHYPCDLESTIVIATKNNSGSSVNCSLQLPQR